jgi:hypothetical protein
MLSESKDGGATFHEIAKDSVHVDYHSIWIAPDDPARIMTGEDGGYALTLDGEHRAFAENVPIGQVYHAGYDDGSPYRAFDAAPKRDVGRTDDGLVQLTRDAGAHWENVTPRGMRPFGRFEIVAPSTLRDGTAYAVLDRHYLGDRTPYVFVTRDFGAHRSGIAKGLPPDQPAIRIYDARHALLRTMVPCAGTPPRAKHIRVRVPGRS